MCFLIMFCSLFKLTQSNFLFSLQYYNPYFYPNNNNLQIANSTQNLDVYVLNPQIQLYSKYVSLSLIKLFFITGSHPNNVATLRRAQHNSMKPPPPARRSSSVISNEQMPTPGIVGGLSPASAGNNAPLGSNSTTPRSSMENLPPPPPHLLHSGNDRHIFLVLAKTRFSTFFNIIRCYQFDRLGIKQWLDIFDPKWL